MQDLIDDDVIDIEIPKLIAAVKKRKALYDPTIPGYRDRCHKKKLWDEVHKELCSNWNSMPKKDQMDYSCEIQKKWNSLRSCFRREIVSRHRYSTGKSKRRKKKYYYFDSLLFLLPFTEKLHTNSGDNSQPEKDAEISSDPLDDQLEDDNSDSSVASPQYTIEEEECIIPIENIKEEKIYFNQSNTEDVVNSKLNKEAQSSSTNRKRNRSEDGRSNSIGEENQITLKTDPVPANDDGDEAFLQSLLPTMKEFTSDQKLLLRIEIMRTILKFKQGCNK